jgi:hypothetical protein
MQKRLIFGVWEPDSNDLTGLGRMSQAVNVIPVKGGYKAINGWGRAAGDGGVAYSSPVFPVAANILGAFSAKDPVSRQTVDFMADTTSIYTANFDRTSVGLSTTAPVASPAGAFRDFAQYGKYIFVANGTTGGAGNVSYFDLENLSNSWTAPAFTTATLRAKTVDVLRDFVVVGNTIEDVGPLEYWPNRVRWGAFGNPTDFVPSAATQSDYQDLNADIGPVQRVVGGNEAFIACQDGVAIMRYTGGATIMRFDYPHKGIGTDHPASCVRVGGYLYMFSRQGFVRLGTQEGDVAWIGSGRVDKEFRYRIELTSPYPRANGYHDQLNGGIGWQYTNSDGLAFFYSYIHDKWTIHGDAETDDRNGACFIYSSDISVLGGATYGTGNGVPTATALATTASDGTQLMAQNDQDNKARVTLATGVEELSPGRRSVIDKVWPLCELRDSGLTTPVMVISSFSDAVNPNTNIDTGSGYSSTASLQAGGFFTITGAGSREGKYHRFVLSNSRTAASRANEQEYLGMDVEFFPRGKY